MRCFRWTHRREEKNPLKGDRNKWLRQAHNHNFFFGCSFFLRFVLNNQLNVITVFLDNLLFFIIIHNYLCLWITKPWKVLAVELMWRLMSNRSGCDSWRFSNAFVVKRINKNVIFFSLFVSIVINGYIFEQRTHFNWWWKEDKKRGANIFIFTKQSSIQCKCKRHVPSLFLLEWLIVCPKIIHMMINNTHWWHNSIVSHFSRNQ